MTGKLGYAYVTLQISHILCVQRFHCCLKILVPFLDITVGHRICIVHLDFTSADAL